MKKLKLLMVFLLLGVSSVLLAQSSVTGTVADTQGMPIPGASIVVKGTSNGTVTDFDGNFSIVVDDGNVLSVSYLGYKPVEVTYSGQSNIQITMEEDTAQLDEVVVIGYGSVKKSDLTGAVTSVDNETLTEQRKTDIGQALQGRVAGVDVRTLSSKPGAPLSIKIRGNTVITNTNVDNDGVSDDVSRDLSKPLYVVDGIFFDNINILNPADIEQMDILKDASATAIYGSRGANGVVIITTKNGVEGKTVFTYDASFGLRSATNIPEMMSGSQYVEFVDDVLRAEQYRGFFTEGSTGTVADFNNITIDRSEEIQTSNSEASNVANGNFTNWVDLLRHTGFQTSHTLGMSGGENGLVYSGSLGYLSDEGLTGIEGFERYNLSASISKKISDKVTVGIKSYLGLSEREEGSRELFRTSFRMPPSISPYDENGNIINFPNDQDTFLPNPLLETNGTWFTNTRTMDVIATAFLNYKPTEWLNFKTQFAPNLSTTRFGEYRGLLSKSGRGEAPRTAGYYNTNFGTSYTWDNILDLDFEIADGHELKTTMISSIYYNQNEGSISQTRNFDTDAYSFYNLEGGTDIRDYDTFYQKETLASFAGRLNYSIKNKYLFTATGRYDGSSKLATGNKWKFFPSAAFAWRASQEEFLKEVSWLNNLKLRLSYGESGNDSRVEPYSSLSFLSSSNYLFGDNIGLGKIVSGLANNQLTWETSKEYNVGLDLSILNSRLGLGFEYYNKTTDDSILDRQLSSITGFGTATSTASATGNFGSVRNSGVEITLNTVNVKTENFSWRTSINYTRNKNEILELDGDLQEIPYGRYGVLKVGSPIDAVYHYENLGIWQLDEAAEAISYNAAPGMYKFKDQNNDNLINEDDKVVIGSNSPDWIGGMTNTFVYKNLDLNVQVNTRQGVFGHSEFFQNLYPAGDPATFNSLNLDYWTPNNQSGTSPIPGYGQENISSNSDQWFFEDMSFVRVSNIGVGYEFPKSLTDELNMNSFRISLDVQNPFVFTDYVGPDPETGLQNSYNMTFAVKTVLLGLKLSF
ncbi:SusC/RagA family TonB-linked outer membrane protein [Maribacter dokdonensis]|uniref:SusC/RagA family TonB-linked outer membrane protein n=1 Tax=Maribacter dokdonensis TaxID=320912 RepID=UPI002AAF113E|nr:TonB-dependent receptor [Maribacter dokdonensis]